MDYSNKSILIVTRSFDHLQGGFEVHTQLIVRSLIARGNKVTVLTTDVVEKKESFQNIEIVRLKAKVSPYIKYSLSFLRAVSHYLRANSCNYDVVVSVGIATALSKRSKNVKMITIFHGVYLLEIKSMIDRFNRNFFDWKAFLGIFYCLIFICLDLLSIYNADKIITTSPVVEQNVKKYPFVRNKIININNFVDLDRFRFEQKDFISNFVYIGRLSSEKSPLTIVQAIKILKSYNISVNFDFYGDGPEKEKIMKFVNSNKLDVNFFSEYQHNDLPKILSRYDYLIMASNCLSEGLPLTILEAGATGLLVIVSDIPANKIIIQNDENGLIFKRNNPADLSNVLKKILNMDKESKIKMTRNFINDIKNKFNSEHNLVMICETIEH